jgi:histone acetyltransferase (RNA polymerase elongator complex component)
MVGLPGSSKKIETDTIKKIKLIKPDYLRIYPLVIIKDTELEKLYYNKKFKPLSVKTIADRVSDYLIQLENTNIKIIRIGLHSEQNFVNTKIIDTGSYHPAIGEMIKSEFIKKKITTVFKKNGCNYKNCVIKYCPDIYSIVIGHKKNNIKFYVNNNIKFKPDKRLKKQHIMFFYKNKKLLDFNI